MSRALLVSDLLTIYQRVWSGRLSGNCGTVSAGCAAGAAIAYLLGESENMIARTLIHAIDLSPEIVCSGAKASCAVKLAAAVETGILGYQTALYQQKTHVQDDLPDADAAVHRTASES